MSTLEIQLNELAHRFAYHTDLYDLLLKNSHGEPTMSPEDTKLVILALRGMIDAQELLVTELVREVQELKNKKPLWKRLLKK